MTADHVELFRDHRGEWRWRRTAPNGEVVANSGEGYVHRQDAVANLVRVNGDDVVYTVEGEAGPEEDG